MNLEAGIVALLTFECLCRFKDLLLIKLALMPISGIITTFLGETATITKDIGRIIQVHHSKTLPLLLTGERLFFGLKYRYVKWINIHKIQIDKLYTGCLIRAPSEQVQFPVMNFSCLKT
ncbi:MAG: hypothetical protein ACI9H8_001042 [Lysobacterales bacterium]|jgi:hypothetical protein